MRKCVFLLMIIPFIGIKAQIYSYDESVRFPTMDLYDTGTMNMALRHSAAMAERVRNISYTIQPQRELQYQKYREGKYADAIKICIEVLNRYVYYVVDHQATSDMEQLAADCAIKIKEYELAISFYQSLKDAKIDGMDSKLSNIFNIKMNDARNSFRNRNYSSLWNDVAIALKTGWESGECYYYYGACYENSNNISEAKKMYRLAKKKKYTPAATALKSLKNRKKNKGNPEVYY